MRADAVLALPRAQEDPGYPNALALAAFWAAIRGEFSLAEELCEAAMNAEAAQDVASPSVVPLELNVALIRINVAIMRGAWSEAAQRQIETAQLGRAYGLDGFAATNLGAAAAVMTFGGEDTAAVSVATEA